MNYKNLIVDANIFIALARPEDSLHRRAGEIVHEMSKDEVMFHTNNYVVAEALTVTLLRSKDTDRVLFLEKYFFHERNNNLKISSFDAKEESIIRNYLVNQEKYKGAYLSYTDYSLIVQARKQKIPTIFTFDKSFAQFKKEFEIIGI